jgi:hypothetical protein
MSEADRCGMCQGRPREEVKYVTMCSKHQQETNEDDARRAGIPDLQYSKAQLATPEGRTVFMNDIQFRLEAHPTKYINIKVTV